MDVYSCLVVVCMYAIQVRTVHMYICCTYAVHYVYIDSNSCYPLRVLRFLVESVIDYFWPDLITGPSLGHSCVITRYSERALSTHALPALTCLPTTSQPFTLCLFFVHTNLHTYVHVHTYVRSFREQLFGVFLYCIL